MLALLASIISSALAAPTSASSSEPRTINDRSTAVEVECFTTGSPTSSNNLVDVIIQYCVNMAGKSVPTQQSNFTLKDGSSLSMAIGRSTVPLIPAQYTIIETTCTSRFFDILDQCSPTSDMKLGGMSVDADGSSYVMEVNPDSLDIDETPASNEKRSNSLEWNPSTVHPRALSTCAAGADTSIPNEQLDAAVINFCRNVAGSTLPANGGMKCDGSSDFVDGYYLDFSVTNDNATLAHFLQFSDCTGGFSRIQSSCVGSAEYTTKSGMFVGRNDELGYYLTFNLTVGPPQCADPEYCGHKRDTRLNMTCVSSGTEISASDVSPAVADFCTTAQGEALPANGGIVSVGSSINGTLVELTVINNAPIETNFTHNDCTFSFTVILDACTVTSSGSTEGGVFLPEVSGLAGGLSFNITVRPSRCADPEYCSDQKRDSGLNLTCATSSTEVPAKDLSPTIASFCSSARGQALPANGGIMSVGSSDFIDGTLVEMAVINNAPHEYNFTNMECDFGFSEIVYGCTADGTTKGLSLIHI